jgi:hypothetical protein
MLRFLCTVLAMQSVVTAKCRYSECHYAKCPGAFSIQDWIAFQLVNTMDGDMNNSGCQSHKTFRHRRYQIIS